MKLPFLRWSLLVVSALTAGAGFAACSSNSSGHADAGAVDAADEADDVSVDVTTPPEDVSVYPDAPSLLSPDGCYRQSAACMDDTTCCSGYCVDGGCTIPPRQM
ncbi:MAG TPA: hypothetical protein VHS09_12935 [Polyangiaceae bacterium]|nr:hypothetical protein [Polyangiaceae bacterium]